MSKEDFLRNAEAEIDNEWYAPPMDLEERIERIKKATRRQIKKALNYSEQREIIARMNSCSGTLDERMTCMFDILHEITEKQDIANIHMIKKLNNDSDPRWIPLHMIDNANAVILGISRNKGRPDIFIPEGYVGEKINDLSTKMGSLKLMKFR